MSDEYEIQLTPYAKHVFKNLANELIEARKEYPNLTDREIMDLLWGDMKWVEI